MNFSSLNAFTIQVCTVSRCDRWRVYQRLQELEISCQCGADGQLAVVVHSPIALLQLRSVVLSITASRQDLVDWLGRCWQAPL